jgi:predicted RNase H-like nuclease
MNPSWIAGIDGFRRGWFVVLVNHAQGRVIETHHYLCSSFKDVLNLTPAPKVIAIDIPIGLLDTPEIGGRECDREARRLLKHPRASSVFSPPIRKYLPAQTHSEAPGISIQTFGILPKIREVDEQMTPELQNRVVEVHPELSFYHLAGRAMQQNKKKPGGREERLDALLKIFPNIREEVCSSHLKVPYDDMIDAYAAAWTAMRIENGIAKCFPENPPVDSKKLRMEIWS